MVLGLLWCGPVAAQRAKDYRTAVYQGYLSNDKARLQEVVTAMEKDKSVAGNNLLMAYYVLLNSTFADADEKLFGQYVDRAEKLGENLIKENQSDAVAHALLSAVYGLKIAYAPMKGMFLGPKSQKHIALAIKHGEKEPVVWLVNGSSKFNTPETWGGSVEEAIASFDKAVALFECHDTNLNQNWAFLHALAWQGLAYSETGAHAPALKAFQRALEVAPEFLWVRESLMPQLAEKMR